MTTHTVVIVQGATSLSATWQPDIKQLDDEQLNIEEHDKRLNIEEDNELTNIEGEDE
ncbi:hypothetical protein K443DRAFT_8327 [Laccaria amethystina LaAM-08-1]|uniref:Uncharacterized protein n=1 Tax=Laccaria amethystina LaAM-08-1 TaxID=1095629 RepID=A0A0C9XDD0_9AGAR|nr:hypothetical protein K443DRAFT_8327 [Laccaria amethystina LaAM-08-1]